MLVILAGLPGAGKSTLAWALAERLDGAVLDKDLIRAALFAPGDVEYSAEQDDFCMSVMLAAADWLWKRRAERVVFLDGRTFSRAYQIRAAIQHAERRGVRWKILECVCGAGTARARLEKDLAGGLHPARNRDLALYEAIRGQFEPVTPPKLVVDTDLPLEDCVGQCLAHLAAASRADSGPAGESR